MQRILDLISTVALVIIAGLFVSDFVPRARPKGQRTLPTNPVSLAKAARLGSQQAPVALLVFSDFQCPFCAQLGSTILPSLRARYVDAGKLQIVFRHYFNRESHPLAPQLAQMSICAEAQGRFWEIHDRLFSLPQPIEPASFTRVAAEFSGDRLKFDECLDTNAFERLTEDRREADKLGVVGTPTSFVGRTDAQGQLVVRAVIDGAQPLSAFVDAMAIR